MDKYSSFAARGNAYQIPANHHETVKMLYEMPQEMAEKALSCTGDGPSLRQWRQVHNFFDERGVGIGLLEPAWFEYKDVQASEIEGSLDREKEAIRDLDQKARAGIYDANKPTLPEEAKAASVAAVAEGLTSFASEVVKRKKVDKDIRAFTGEDWKEIAASTGFGTFKGTVRGTSMYVLDNYTFTSSAVASAIKTASFGIAGCANRFRKGDISEFNSSRNSNMPAWKQA